jgi:hypothetical protein
MERRRQYLKTIAGAGLVVGSVGCLGGRTEPDSDDESAAGTTDSTPESDDSDDDRPTTTGAIGAKYNGVGVGPDINALDRLEIEFSDVTIGIDDRTYTLVEQATVTLPSETRPEGKATADTEFDLAVGQVQRLDFKFGIRSFNLTDETSSIVAGDDGVASFDYTAEDADSVAIESNYDYTLRSHFIINPADVDDVEYVLKPWGVGYEGTWTGQ